MYQRGVTFMKSRPSIYQILSLLAFFVVIAAPAAGASTTLHIVKYANDGVTVLNETTVDYRWMEQNLPVMGDGQTHYYLQGPVFVNNPDDRWNPEEDSNVLEKDMGAVKGTDLRDLCDLVGGMEPGDTVTLRALDGFSKIFAYENVYEPLARQGAMVIAWYDANQSYVPGYADGMRLIFFADTSTNPWGVHAMGNYDWHESAAEEYWYYYYQGQELYPTTTGLSVKYISDIQIWSSLEPEGSIEVTSDPAGARIYLDGVDTGYDTPCTLEKLSEGFYSLTVQKAGYLTSEEQSVELIAGKKITVSFDLVPVPQGGGDSGSGGGEGEYLLPSTDQSLLAGGQLSGTDYLRTNGSFILLSSRTSPFTLNGGGEHLLTFDTNQSAMSPALIRLYLFLDMSSADPGTSTEPQILVSTKQGESAPIRTYSEGRDDGNQPYATTLVYNLQQLNENGIYTISSKNSPSWNSTVAGALLVVGYDEKGGKETWAWICEGVDLIGGVSGQETPMTLAEFSGEFPSREPVNATLFTVTTPSSAAGNLSFYINGVSIPGQLVSSEGVVAVYKILVADLPENAVFRLNIGTKGPVVTNRVAILTVDVPQISQELPTPPPKTVGVLNQTVPSTSNASVNPLVEVTPGEFLPAGGQKELPGDPIGKFLCWLLNLILMLGGQPPDSCYQPSHTMVPANNTAIPTPKITGSSVPLKVNVSSSPEGATVFLDDQPTGLVTPCELEVSPGGMHSVRVMKDGYQPNEQQITGFEGIEVLLQPATPIPENTGTSVSLPEKSHHGGVYIHSYPEKVEIRIDGVLAGTSSPVLVNPLKEGFHTITAGIPSGTNGYSARESIRTWIFPDAIVPVEFNLMDVTESASVNITGESRTGVAFTVNGYYPVKRIPERVELTGNPSFITLTNGSSYLSFTIPVSSREGGQFTIPATEPSICTLSVESVPNGAEIFLDGIRTGLLTPAVIPNVSAGYHRISVTSPGRIPVTELIHIADSQCFQGGYKVHYSLEWYPSGGLHITSDPPGAAVSIRGLKTGEVTPCTLDDIPIGIWEVTLTNGKTKRGIDAIVEPDKIRTYSVVFD
jgi:hypothetical protein